MRTWMRLLAVVGVLAVMALLAQSTTALAAEEVPERDVGRLVAQGSGTAWLHGRGMVRISGSGILYVRDNAGDGSIDVQGYGHRFVRDDGTIVFFGFHGRAQIEGSNLTVRLIGTGINLEAVGHGRFTLRGEGRYHTSMGAGHWPAAGTYGVGMD